MHKSAVPEEFRGKTQESLELKSQAVVTALCGEDYGKCLGSWSAPNPLATSPEPSVVFLTILTVSVCVHMCECVWVRVAVHVR